jgi:hypothetical protein
VPLINAATYAFIGLTAELLIGLARPHQKNHGLAA